MTNQAILGAQNLLSNAMRISRGDSLLILAESPRYKLYDSRAAQAIADEAERLGARVKLKSIGGVRSLGGPDLSTKSAINDCDSVLFQARLGDALRFAPMRNNTTMSYAYTLARLGSAFCTTSHTIMERVARELEREILASNRWCLTTSSGSQIEGSTRLVGPGSQDHSRRFPLCTIPALSCFDASGVIVVEPWIVSTANRTYANDCIALDGSVQVFIEGGRIKRFEGHASDTERLRSHYEYVASLLDLDRDAVHSWHCGLHPKCGGIAAPSENPDVWGRSVFGSPRCAHFHTCGAGVLGEVCLSVLDATVAFDGRVLWDSGRLIFLEDTRLRLYLSEAGIDPKSFADNEALGTAALSIL